MSDLSRSTDIRNASKLHDNLSDADKLLVKVMADIMLSLLKSVQSVQNTNSSSKPA